MPENNGNDNDNVNNNARVGADQCVCPNVVGTTDFADSRRLFLRRERELLSGGHVVPHPTMGTLTITGTIMGMGTGMMTVKSVFS